ncbi:tRNA (guanine-N(1)-)-methyltransferase [Beauveria bassiana ARSEF 2860]|uniref:tRNA (guanine(37)-N1)-methyltransferase n=1 Tax=Beauveria bassiana (strain ARSEF 2860) TaxID=655819 RepID=J5J9S5_BEAB2|nr:tRNA (guanine-N(1)-)-methyltransferase [Beauveria bassiana ARSEF 2860]EJP63003.1 tRNA (guanine-N(1)-)-methyltransferase [Beauveria bassiana ARSEF 2860]
MNLFRAPAAARAAKTLDRALFARTIPSAAASVRENKLLSKYRKELELTKELFVLQGFQQVAPDPDPALAAKGNKCLVLKSHIKPQEPLTWSRELQEASRIGDLKVIPYDIDINYSLWSYVDVMRSILPEELQNEIPSGFNTAGHVAHLNLRDQYLPYKHIIAQVIIDKNPGIKTVINKVDNVGTESEFRTFAYEVLAGPDDLEVEVSEAGCHFKFDYAKVYWNSKLSTEHQRVAALFQPGEVVVDVMAGIGPFAVPAGKKGVFVWANDKNPASYRYLTDIIQRNKVGEFVRPFNADGHDFIRQACDDVLAAARRGDAAVLPGRKVSRTAAPAPAATRVPVPPTVAHFVMNLPASALEFLHNFRGIYHGQEALFAPHTATRLPLVHAHCFAVKADDATPLEDICDRIEKEIGIRLVPGDANVDGQVSIHEVRDVAPAKRMFCASFRVPPLVAFAARS